MYVLKKAINIEIGQRVHIARKNSNLSRDELAEKLNISSLFMGYIECGEKGMSLSTLKNLCNTLNVSADYILLGIEDSTNSTKNINVLLNTLESKYIPVVELQLKNLIHAIKEIETLNYPNQNT